MNKATDRATDAPDIDESIAALSPARGALLARRLTDPSGRTSQRPLVRTIRGNEAVPLSFAQQRLWLLDRLLPNAAVYNMPKVLRLVGALDVAALRDAINEVVRRHETLRTTFAVENGAPVQLIVPALELALEVEDLRGLADAKREAEANHRVQAEAQGPFDLARGPLLRARLLRLGKAEHWLLVTLHHIATDGWSMGVLWREVSTLYSAYSRGEASPLPELPVQYADYAVWQRDWFQGAMLEEQLDYWKEALAGLPVLELPTDRPRPPVASYRGRRLTFELGVELTGALRALARQEEATLFMTLLAAFQVLLCRYSGQEDVAVGVPVAGRVRPQLEGLIGFFVNTLVLRGDLSGAPSFKEYLGQVRTRALAAYAHQDLPFEKLVEVLLTQRDQSRNPLFQVLFTQWRHEDQVLQLAELEPATAVAVDTETAKSDLDFTVFEKQGRCHVTAEYAADLFDAATIERMAGHWRVLLEGIVDDPDSRIGELPLLTEVERHQLLVQWNDTAVDYPRDHCIHQLFEEQVARNPDAEAVMFSDERLTYRELNARANQLAHQLRTLGVGPEVLVGTCLERSLELVIGLLGILKAGGAYVPLDPSYPTHRLAFMLEDTQAPVLLTQEPLLGLLPPYAGRTLCLDRDWPTIAAQPATNPPTTASAEALAYVMYTSGSTGTPKGVMVPHRCIARLVCDTNYIRLDPTDCVAQVSNPSFDAATFEVWGALAHGSRLTVIPREVALDPTRLAAELRGRGVSTLFLTTALFNAVVRARPNAFASLKQVLFGGETVDPNCVRDCLGAGGPQRLLHVYGPTETTTFATWHLVEAVAPGARTIPIGRPIANTVTHVLDGHGQPVPVGVAGELHIGGDGLARGYWNRPELTAARFVPDPFIAHPGARLYRTGDRVRYLPDGNLEFLGRLDNQVKLRGFRIELGEIEAVLAQQPQVREAVVQLREDTPGDPRLVAYVVARHEAPVAADLRTALKQQLPDHMVPAAFVLLPALPLTSNGKIDRKALPTPQGGTEAALSSPPRNPVEEAVARIWCELLHLRQVGVHDSFFDLGGHSLLVIQMLSRLRNLFGVEVSVRTLFDAPTIAELAEHVSAALAGGAQDRALPIQPVPRTAPLPLSFAQQRLWFLERLAPQGAAYNIAFALPLQGELDATALEAGLNAIVARHEPLRTTFAECDDAPFQVIAPELRIALTVEDLGPVPAAQRGAAYRQRANDAAQARFDLERGPMLRATLLRLAEREHVLVLAMHHIVSDGWSMGVLLRELSASYGAFVKGETPCFAALPIQYADYAVWQRSLLAGATLGRQLKYWTGQLAGMSPLRLPTDAVHPAMQRLSGSRKQIRLPAALTDALQRLSKREGVTLFMTLLAAFQVLLARHSGQWDIAVGTPIAGRTRRETEGLIGFFVNTLVLRTDVSGNPSFQVLLRQVREVCLGAYANQDLPFEKLVEVLNPVRDLRHHPLFDVMLNLMEATEDAPQLDGLTSESLALDTAYAKFAITLYVKVQASGIDLSLVYQDALFSAERMAELLEQYHHLLMQIAENSEQTILSYSLVTPAARLQLPDPSAAIDEPHQVPVTELFASWTERRPESVAVSQGARQWTYRALAEAANRLALSLRRRGIGRGDVVAIIGSRNFGLVSSMLGVSLSGGVLVTVDSALPEARRRVMLREARATAICRVGAARLSEVVSEADAIATVFDIDPDLGIAVTRDIGQPPEAAPLPPISGDDAAYIFFTSGSTGVPKGVLGCHKGLSHFLNWQRDTFGIGPNDRVAQLTSLSFDPLLRDVFLPLTSGGTLCIPEEGDQQEPLAWLARERVTVVHTVPTLLQSWLAQQQGGAELHALRWLFVAGEPLSGALVQAWRDGISGGAEMVNLYGPTETTLVKCFHRIAGEIEPGLQPVGVPLPQTQALVLNSAGQPCGIGELGEVVLRTPFRTLGYINSPPEMHRQFVPNPFRDDADDLLYFTGDRGLYRVDGTLDLLGRLDDQLKIRGVRVEPGEVTAVLAEHPAVRAGVVIGRKDALGGDALVAYVVSASDQRITVGELRSFLGARLPAALVPSEWQFLDALPQLPNGKVDRSALPVPAGACGDLDVAYVAPRTSIESKLVAIWLKVLSVAQVGIHDNFFAVGGHSLTVMQLIVRIRREFGVTLPLRQIFETPMVADLAAIIERMPQDADNIALERILDELELITDEVAASQLRDQRDH